MLRWFPTARRIHRHPPIAGLLRFSGQITLTASQQDPQARRVLGYAHACATRAHGVQHLDHRPGLPPGGDWPSGRGAAGAL